MGGWLPRATEREDPSRGVGVGFEDSLESSRVVAYGLLLAAQAYTPPKILSLSPPGIFINQPRESCQAKERRPFVWVRRDVCIFLAPKKRKILPLMLWGPLLFSNEQIISLRLRYLRASFLLLTRPVKLPHPPPRISRGGREKRASSSWLAIISISHIPACFTLYIKYNTTYIYLNIILFKNFKVYNNYCHFHVFIHS